MVVSEYDANAVVIPGGQKNFQMAAQRNEKGLLTTIVGGVGDHALRRHCSNENNLAESLMQCCLACVPFGSDNNMEATASYGVL